MNKVILEMSLPTDCSDKEQVSSFLAEQTQTLVRLWKDVLLSYKERGIDVPAIAIRGAAPKKEINGELKVFRTALLEHLLQFQPKVVVGPQIKVITELFGLDKPVEEWIALFERSRSNYKLTTWLTVKYHLNRDIKEDTSEFDIKELGEEDVEGLRDRFKSYGE